MTPEQAAAAMAAGTFAIFLSIFWLLVWAGLAIGVGFIAGRLKKNVALWVILSLIPVYNLFFFYYVAFYVVCHVIARLDDITARIGASPAKA